MSDVVERYRAGESIREIAVFTDSNYSAVRRALVAAGVKLRPARYPFWQTRSPNRTRRSDPGMYGVPNGWEELP